MAPVLPPEMARAALALAPELLPQPEMAPVLPPEMALVPPPEAMETAPATRCQTPETPA